MVDRVGQDQAQPGYGGVACGGALVLGGRGFDGVDVGTVRTDQMGGMPGQARAPSGQKPQEMSSASGTSVPLATWWAP